MEIGIPFVRVRGWKITRVEQLDLTAETRRCEPTGPKFRQEIVNDSDPNDDVGRPKRLTSPKFRLLTAFAVNLFCLFSDSVGLLEWIPLPAQIQTVFLLSACLIASVVILYPTSWFQAHWRGARVALLCLLGVGIEVCAFILVLILFMVRNGLFPKS